MTKLTVHPAADIFPMMSSEELADLAGSIKADGQLFPIVLDGDVLIDGRNRLAACKLAGVEPTFEQLSGRDPLAFIANANLKRRNLSKGQQAMALAMIYPEPERGRGKKDPARKETETGSFSFTRVKAARSVFHFSPDLAVAVLGGAKPLDEALAEVKTKRALLSSEAVKMVRLDAEAPDLAEPWRHGRTLPAAPLGHHRAAAGVRGSLWPPMGRPKAPAAWRCQSSTQGGSPGG
jgi:hypothetical protein